MSNLKTYSEDDNISTGDEAISSPARKLRKTCETNTEKHVTPLASPGGQENTCVKENKKDSLYVEQKDEDKHVLCMFPFTGVQGIFRQEIRRLKNDPRGYFPRSDLFMPDNYCLHCCCPKPKCHDLRFGLYCGLRVAEDVKQYRINKMHTEKVDELVLKAYNEILRVTVVQELGVLDTHNKYELPKCLQNRTVKNVMRHFCYQKFSNAMENRLTDGSMNCEGSGKMLFFKALNDEDLKK